MNPEKLEVGTSKGLTAYIVQDYDEHNAPSEWGNEDVFLIANHREFYVEPPHKMDFLEAYNKYEKTHHIFPLEAYIHSGVSLALAGEGGFPDRQWDVSELGAVFVEKKTHKTKDKARKAALGLIDTWNMYLSGDVYGYIIEDELGENLDSVWGYYGEEHAKEAALEALEYQAEKYQKEKQEKLGDGYIMGKTLGVLLTDTDATISRHALGILKALKHGEK